MEIKFELTLTVTGHSLQEIDDALVQAAGERLKARILAKSGQGSIESGKGGPMPGIISIKQGAEPEADKKAKGKPPVNEKTSQKEESHGEKEEKDQQKAVPNVPGVIKSEYPSNEEAVKSLSAVNERFGIDKAKACLHHFSVGRVRDLPDHARGEFIRYCDGVISGP